MISHKTKLKLIKEIRKKTGIKFWFRFKNIKHGAEAEIYPEKRLIIFHNKLRATRNNFISTVFHEIYHIIAYENKEFWAYHRPYITSKKRARDYISTALRAEQYVDRKAEELCRKHYKDVKWDWVYLKQKNIQWFDEFLDETRIEWGMKPKRRKRG